MTQKCFWRAILIVVLSVGLAMPARADNPVKVLIVIAATTMAASGCGRRNCCERRFLWFGNYSQRRRRLSLSVPDFDFLFRQM